MKLKYTLAALAVTTIGAHAAITATKDTADFNHNYDGNEIWDGTSYVGDWSEAGPGVDESLVGGGTVLRITNQGVDNGWIQIDNGTSDFEAITGDYTLEVTVTLDGTDGFALWSDPNGPGDIIYIGANGIGTGGNGTGSNQDLSSVSNVGTHTFRLAHDSTLGELNLWRDGVLVTDALPVGTLGLGGPRLIVGDCCSGTGGVLFDSIDIHNISYDTTGGFAPVPEPSSAALLGLGGLALILRRRK